MEKGGEKAGGLTRTDSGVLRPNVADASILFSGIIILFVLTGYRVQSREFYSGILITVFVIMLLPALLFVAISKARFTEVLRLDSFRPVNIPIVVGIMLFAIPLTAVFNLLNLFLVNSIFGRVAVVSLPVAETGSQLLVNLLVIAGSAGICEEVLFRGVIQRAFEPLGTARSILFAALLFSLTHLDLQKIFGTFFLGALIGYIVYRTKSLYCGILAHFTNNAVAVVAAYLSEKMLRILQPSEGPATASQDISALFDVFAGLPTEQMIFVFMIYGFLLLFTVTVLILLVFLMTRVNPVRQKAMPYDFGITGGSLRKNAKGLLWLLPGLLLILLWFYSQAHGLLGTQNAVTEIFRWLVGAGA